MPVSRLLPLLLSVDGGIDLENGPRCAALGADMLVMGAFTFYRGGLSRERIRETRQVLDGPDDPTS